MFVREPFETEVYWPLNKTARRLGFPTKLIKELAEEGIIPSLSIGGRLRFHIEAVIEVLDKLADSKIQCECGRDIPIKRVIEQIKEKTTKEVTEAFGIG